MKFRKKPVVIEAVQFHTFEPWPDGVIDATCLSKYGETHSGPHVATLEGMHCVSDGDWIVTGIKGERYPVKPDIFAATYEAVP